MSILNKNFLALLGLLILIISIPLTVYLVRQRQVIKSKALVKSKLSFQTSWQRPGAMEFIETAKPVVVKLLDGYDRASEIKQKSPGTFVVGRKWEQNQPFDGEPEARAQEWFDRNRGVLGLNNIDCWEGYNEPPTNNTGEIGNMQWYSRFEIKRMQLLESIGKKACIGNFSVGNPDFPLWPYFKEAMNWARDRGHYLGLHEYGPTSMSDRAEYFSLRHRRVYQENGFSTPLIITETGIDENGNPDTGGWRAHTNATDYFNQLKWYDDRLQEDSYVKGATIFSYGLYDWDSFEIYPDLTGFDGRSGALPQYIAGGGPAPTPIPTGAPGPCLVSWMLSNSTPPPNTNITVAIHGDSDPLGWQNIGLTKDGSTDGVTWNGIGDPWPTFNYTVGSGTAGTHTLKFTTDYGSRTCTPEKTFTTSGPTPTPGTGISKLYIEPNPANPLSSVTVYATSTTSCSTNISTNFGAGLSCGNPLVLTCSDPNPKNDGNPCWWKWSCQSNATPGNYTASFDASGQNCGVSKDYTISSVTPTPTPVSVIAATFDDKVLDISGQNFTTVTLHPLGSAAETIVPVVVSYSQGSPRTFYIRFIYQPPTSTPTLTPTPIPSPSIYDLNNDKIVNSIDVGVLFSIWREQFSGVTPTRGDFNNDGVINSIDYAMLKSQLTR